MLNQQTNTTRENKMNKPSLFYNEWKIIIFWLIAGPCQVPNANWIQQWKIGFISFCNFNTIMECLEKDAGQYGMEWNTSVSYTIPS